jgi:hypothetical protein
MVARVWARFAALNAALIESIDKTPLSPDWQYRPGIRLKFHKDIPSPRAREQFWAGKNDTGMI